MSHLPVIIGFGGVNPAGRSSFHHAYRRLILDSLGAPARQETLLSLATLMGLARSTEQGLLDPSNQTIDPARLGDLLGERICNDTLIRRIHPDWFDVDRVVFNKAATLSSAEGEQSYVLRRRQLPNVIPPNWQLQELGGGRVRVNVQGELDVILPDFKEGQVKVAGQLPTGFQPGTLYQSRNHPRNLQMTIFGASDALHSSGIPWEAIRARLSPDQVAVYAGNSIGQLDDYGFGGLIKSPYIGKRTTSKQMPLGYGQMPADFINAYILGSLGATGSSLGACATFLYNLSHGVEDIRSGRRKVVLVGTSDAPVTPEIIEGFRVMGALAEDKDLMALDGLTDPADIDYRRACRPFANNCGFTMGESSQFILLCADDLALELGAQIFGAVPDVFISADGHKKSISAPGIGNYITLGKAANLVRTLLGEASLQQRSFVQAHGTSTPQNRVTESHVINETAKAFGIPDWTISAVKCYLGHSQGTAGGDQLTTSLGVWADGIIPGITTLDAVADDVHRSNLRFERQHHEVGSEGMDSVLLNSKGFGGNNASAPVLAPHIVRRMLEKKYGKAAFSSYQKRLASTQEAARAYDQEATLGRARPTYLFGHNVLTGEELSITDKEIRIPGYEQPVSLDVDNPYDSFC